MVKIIAMYKKPADPAAFDKHYFDVHLPLTRKTPGLRKLEVTKISGSPFGESPLYIMAEMYYDSMDALNAANASAEGKAVVKDLMTFMGDVHSVVFGEVQS